MSDFYINLRDETVIPLIIEFGQTITLTRNGDGGDWVKEFVPDEGRYQWRNTSTSAIVYEPPAPAETTINGIGVITNFEDATIDETLVKRGDKLLLTIDLGEPQINDKFQVGGVTYNYINHETVSPGGTDVLYKIQLRL